MKGPVRYQVLLVIFANIIRLRLRLRLRLRIMNDDYRMILPPLVVGSLVWPGPLIAGIRYGMMEVFGIVRVSQYSFLSGFW